MLRQRVITAVVLLVLLGAVLGSGSAIAFVLTLAIFFGAACWEALKLSGMRFALPLALMLRAPAWALSNLRLMPLTSSATASPLRAPLVLPEMLEPVAASRPS